MRSGSAWGGSTAGKPVNSRRHALLGRERELARLDELLAAVRVGGSGSLSLVGEAGLGKSALLEHLAGSAAEFQVVRAAGVEGEIDLPYAGLQQLCRSMLDQIEVLPQPQANALRAAFGLASGDATDRYLVGLAVLGLLSEVAADRPLLCVVDDAQWLDQPTVQALAFVARRLGADSVALMIASRAEMDELADMPSLQLGGLPLPEARALLDSVLMRQLDAPVRERLLAETRGNPLAVLELPHTLTRAEVASGILRPEGGSLSTRIEDSFRQRVEQLPDQTQQLLLLAAADSLGDPLLLWRAAEHANLPADAADRAVDAGLFEIREQCVFRHPLVRSATYRSASENDRRTAHAILADVTDEDKDADRKAWHRAQATAVPDEDIAAALEHTASRARARGGLAAAGSFLERAAQLTPDPGRRLQRALAAAEMLLEAGALASVETLLRTIDTSGISESSELQQARTDRLHAEVMLVREDGDKTAAILQMLNAADRLEPFDRDLGQAIHLRVLDLGLNHLGVNLGPEGRAAVVAIAHAPPRTDHFTPQELMIRGYARIFAEGFPAGIDLMRAAMVALRDAPGMQESDFPLLEACVTTAGGLWDLVSEEALIRRGVELARRVGALPRLQTLLSKWGHLKVYVGDFTAADALFAEAETLSKVTGTHNLDSGSSLDAVRWECDEALRRLEEHEGQGIHGAFWILTLRARAFNGAGRYEQALELARRAVHHVGAYSHALIELVEAAVRCGDLGRARDALEPLVARTQLGGTDWALGLEARCRALVSDAENADVYYREAVERLGRAGTRPALARAHLLYGEWLRREGRRRDAREHLRTALELFETVGMPGFAQRTRRELVATGETARKRVEETRTDLTRQESQIARLAADGLTNAEIGAQLFLSPRTVEFHLRHVYPKLGVSSRRELWKAVAIGAPTSGSSG
ncbi:AAA family ATPase [Kribbella qitaiheensis]|uniref:AAA family ATPase n=1 Tax=Kribbella qitaiheensis TaxID=1544730 RepID=UPI003619C8A4